MKRKVKSVPPTAGCEISQSPPSPPTHSTFAYHNLHQKLPHILCASSWWRSLQPFFFDLILNCLLSSLFLYIYVRKKRDPKIYFLHYFSIQHQQRKARQGKARRTSTYNNSTSNGNGERCRGGVESSPGIPVPSYG